MTVGGGRKRSTRKNKKVVKRGRKTVRSKTARKQRLRRVRGGWYADGIPSTFGGPEMGGSKTARKQRLRSRRMREGGCNPPAYRFCSGSSWDRTCQCVS